MKTETELDVTSNEETETDNKVFEDTTKKYENRTDNKLDNIVKENNKDTDKNKTGKKIEKPSKNKGKASNPNTGVASLSGMMSLLSFSAIGSYILRKKEK